MQCSNCEGNNLSLDNQQIGYLVCLDCGYRDQSYQANTAENNFESKVTRHSKILPFRDSQTSVEDQISSLTQSQKNADDSLNPNASECNNSNLSVDTFASKNLLEGFQSILLQQTKILIEKYHQPQILKNTVGRIWIRLLSTWREKGWGNGRPMRIRRTSQKYRIRHQKTFEDQNSSSSEEENGDFFRFNIAKSLRSSVGLRTYKCMKFNDEPRAYSRIYRRPNRGFTSDKKSVRDTEYRKPGDLCLEMTLAILWASLRWTRSALTLSDILFLVRTGALPFLNCLPFLSDSLVRNLREVQINSKLLLDDFFCARDIPSQIQVHSLAVKVCKKSNIDAKFLEIDLDNFSFSLRAFLWRLKLPEGLLPLVLQLFALWENENPCPRARSRGDIFLSETLVAFLVVSLKLVCNLDTQIHFQRSPRLPKVKSENVVKSEKVVATTLNDSSTGGSSLESNSEEERVSFFTSQTILSRLSTPDGTRRHKIALFGAPEVIKRQVYDSLAAENSRHRSIHLSAKVRSFLHKINSGMRSGDSGVLNIRAQNFPIFSEKILETRNGYSLLLRVVAREANVEINAVHEKVEEVESLLKKANEFVQRKMGPRKYGKISANKFMLRQRILGGAEYLGPVGESGMRKCIRKLRAANGKVYFDCECGRYVPNSNVHNVMKHQNTTFCSL